MKSIQLSKSLLFLAGCGLFTLLLLLGACGADDSDPVPPIITTGGVPYNISVTAVTITSSIEFTQSELITARGVCWGESPAPELGKGTKSTRNGVGEGTFDSQLTNLSISKYYVRAYATIGDNVYYGNEVVIDMNSFVPSITVVEKEGGSANEVLLETSITYTHTAALSEKGICWGAVSNPTVNLSTKIANSSFSLSFSDAITVPEWTSFYVRGYAITEVGVFYSENIQVINIPPVSFGEVTDIDGNTYKTTTIGDKVWMAENLRVTKYNDGTSIASGSELEFKGATEGMYTVYDGNGSNLTNFGYLYNGYTVTSDQNVCMTDWHVATPSEWNDLVRRLGGGETAGGRMKAVSDLWATPNTAADNSSGFSALPGGSYCRVCLSNTGIFADKGTDAYFWSSTAVEFYYVTNNLPSLRAKGTGNKNDGLSIRCVKD